MIDIKKFREQPALFQQAALAKNIAIDVDRIIELDRRVRALRADIEAIRAQKNAASEQIPQAQPNDRKRLIEEMRVIDKRAEEIKEELDPLEGELTTLLNRVPNPAFDDVPVGKDESENVVIRTWSEPTVLEFEPKDHLELGALCGMIETEKAANVTAARFAYLMGDAAMLELALMQFAFSVLTSREKLSAIAKTVGDGCSDKPFIPVFPPVMIRPEVYVRMARLSPEDEDERYYLQKDNLYLVGSAEHTLGPLHMDELLKEQDLPIRYIGFSPAFRREAGSYGKDTRGIIRVHQFDKLEMESFTTQDSSRVEQDFFVAIQEYLLQQLRIPYQVISVCTGDMGKPDARQIDIECWIPSQGKYRETHTADLMTDYQSRRLNTRVKRENGETELVHMNDATFAAVGRLIVAIMENYQQADGSIVVPEVLRPWVGKEVIKTR